MRKYGKWVLTLSLLAVTPGLTFAASTKSKDDKPSTGTRASRTDNQRVADDIANALRGKVNGRDMGIEFKNGTAVLTGSVLDPKIKAKAEELARSVAGVSKVDNRITVVEKKRAFSERLRGGDGDAAPGGVVQAANSGETVKRSKVKQVNSEVPEPGPATQAVSANQEIAQQIGEVLTAAQLDGYDIQIRFQNGVAMLDGSVGTQAERAAAARAASSVQGVRSVANRLRCTDDAAAQTANAGGPGPYGPPRGNVRGAGYMPQGQAYPAQQMAAQIPSPPMPGGGGPMPGGGYPGGGYPGGGYPGGGYQGGYPGGPPMGGPPMGGGVPMGPPQGGAPPYPPSYGQAGMGQSAAVYNNPSMPDYAWPSYAQYPNSAAVSYPQQYSASAWPYIGPFYPYPQVPLGWRDATLRWDDGQWNLMFKPRTDRWWWFLNPNNW
jgi:osmotically-inducible protein OsmY